MSITELHNVTVIGTGGQTMLFSHGFGCDQSMFRHLVEGFREDYRLVLYDLAGSSQVSTERFRPARYASLEGYASDLIDLCEALELRDVIFVGHSVSAMIGVLAANRKPELISSLILIGPSPRYINDGDYFGGFAAEDIKELLEVMSDNYLGWSSQMAPAIMGNPEAPALGQELTNSFCRTNPETARHLAQVTFTSDNRADLSTVRQPTLVIQCSEDIIAPEAVGRYVAERIPDSRFVLLRARGHCPNLSAPADTITAMRTFLNEITVSA